MKNLKAIAMTMALVAGITGTAFAADIREIVGDPGTEITDRNPTCWQAKDKKVSLATAVIQLVTAIILLLQSLFKD